MPPPPRPGTRENQLPYPRPGTGIPDPGIGGGYTDHEQRLRDRCVSLKAKIWDALDNPKPSRDEVNDLVEAASGHATTNPACYQVIQRPMAALNQAMSDFEDAKDKLKALSNSWKENSMYDCSNITDFNNYGQIGGIRGRTPAAIGTIPGSSSWIEGSMNSWENLLNAFLRRQNALQNAFDALQRALHHPACLVQNFRGVLSNM